MLKPFPYELARIFEYDAWASRATFASIRSATIAPEKAVRFMAHVVATLMLWRDRIVSHDARVAVWPEWGVEECASHLDAALAEWRDLTGIVSDGELDRVIHYTNSKGETFSSSFKDIAIHVSMHGAYHRGQIAAELSRAGEKTAMTDFIHASRAGALTE